MMPTPEQARDQLGGMLGSYREVVARHAPLVFMFQTLYFVAFFFWRCSGMMLLGMALYKWGFLDGRLPTGKYVLIAALCLAAGLTLAWYGTVELEAHTFRDATARRRGSLELHRCSVRLYRLCGYDHSRCKERRAWTNLGQLWQPLVSWRSRTTSFRALSPLCFFLAGASASQVDPTTRNSSSWWSQSGRSSWLLVHCGSPVSASDRPSGSGVR